MKVETVILIRKLARILFVIGMMYIIISAPAKIASSFRKGLTGK